MLSLGSLTLLEKQKFLKKTMFFILDILLVVPLSVDLINFF